jgi:hypothetical protein
MTDGVSVAQTKRPVRSSRNGGRRELFRRCGQIGPDHDSTPLLDVFRSFAHYSGAFPQTTCQARDLPSLRFA